MGASQDCRSSGVVPTSGALAVKRSGKDSPPDAEADGRRKSSCCDPPSDASGAAPLGQDSPSLRARPIEYPTAEVGRRRDLLNRESEGASGGLELF